MRIHRMLMVVFLLLVSASPLFAENFYLDSLYNKGTLRFEIDNDAIWDSDSNFSNGWSLQYHTVRYGTWDESKAPGFIKWIGNHFPTLGDDASIVRYGQGIGQNMITPEDITNPNPPPGELPYAGTLTYTLNWQRFNRKTASNFQITAGVLGEYSGSEEFQKAVHEIIGSDEPLGWDTQRDTEPILNLAYQYNWRLAHFGAYTDSWAGQLSLTPTVHLGNLITAAELGLAFRTGWNIPEGFSALPAPPGRGLYTDYHIPKPSNASRHGVELVLAGRATGLAYSVLYDGSKITDDEREVEREDFIFSGLAGLNYHYYKRLSIRLAFVFTSDLLKEEFLPDPQPDEEGTSTDNSFGTFMIDVYF